MQGNEIEIGTRERKVRIEWKMIKYSPWGVQ